MRRIDKRTRQAAALVAAAILLAPVAAIAGLVEDKATATAEKSDKPARGYVLRCWQEGRLIVEENLIALPSSVDLTAAKLKALDADSHAVYVTETKNATCVIRASFPERARGSNY